MGSVEKTTVSKLSLAPLSFQEAVADILKVKPEPKQPIKAKAKKQGKSS